MNYKIPQRLKNQDFVCDNKQTDEESYTYSKDCIKCNAYVGKNPAECWKKQITKELVFDCLSNNAIAATPKYKCPNCNSKDIEIMPNFGIYKITDNNKYIIECNSCGKTEIITESQIEEILGERYEYIDENELNQNIEKTIQNHGVEYLIKLKNPGRNEPCPCGSGKKFKHCHGK